MDTTYNGIALSSVGGITLEVSPPVRAARRIQSIEVPGRNGTVHIDDGSYEAIQKTVRIGVKTPDSIDAINAWCARSGVLYSDYEPNRAYRAVQAPAVEWERVSRRLYQAVVTFECDPFRYLYPEPEDLIFEELPATVTNPGTAQAAPLWTVEGSGDIILTVGNTIVRLTGIGTGIILDSELQLAYLDDTPLGGSMAGEFPLLSPGETEISWTGSVTGLTVKPRWRYL